jgi:CubicO group peptidase (beta-lactamase class C family)
VTKDAIFRLYSMTKPFTSVAAMMLVEDGRILLSDAASVLEARRCRRL